MGRSKAGVWGGYAGGGVAVASRQSQALRRLACFGRCGGFRMIELNLAGWLAVLAPGVLIGVVVAEVLGGDRLVGGALGLSLWWGTALTVDFFRWRQSGIAWQVDDHCRGAVGVAVGQLVEDGVPVKIIEESYSPRGHVVSVEGRMKDRKLIENALRRV